MNILHVNTGRARPTRIHGRTVLTAFAKTPVDGSVAVHRLGLDGDEQADPSVHGGPSKAVYAYPHEHYAFWQTVRAQARVALWDEALAPGAMGENLTLTGLLESQLWIGDRLLVGAVDDDPAAPDGEGAAASAAGCILAVSEPRFPCGKFNAAMGFAQAGRLMGQSGFCGAYLAVLRPGTVRAGDSVRLVPGAREVSLRELFRARAPSGTAAP